MTATKQTTAAPKLHVEIEFESHTYTATVTRPGQLEQFLARKDEKFRITGNMTGTYPAGFASELNRISRFSHSLNRTATAR
jgi:hypothetical protein